MRQVSQARQENPEQEQHQDIEALGKEIHHTRRRNVAREAKRKWADEDEKRRFQGSR